MTVCEINIEMKRIIISLAMIAATLTAMAQLDVESKVTTFQKSDIAICGSAVGRSLKAVYYQFIRDGKLSMNNQDNLLNLKIIKANMGKAKPLMESSYDEFAENLIANSARIVTVKNVDDVISVLDTLNLSHQVAVEEFLESLNQKE